MKEIHQRYTDRFMQVGLPLLEDFGYTVTISEITDISDSTHISILKEGQPSYLLTFSTHHLDYDQGVVIGESEDGKLHWDKIRLPNQFELQNKKVYLYSGEYLDVEIRRLIKNFLYYNQQKVAMQGEPLEYCSQDVAHKGCSCDPQKLSELGSHGTTVDTHETFYKCNACNGFWKFSTDKQRGIWLKVGEYSDGKYSEENHKDYQEKKLNYFPLTFFKLSEAMAYGLQIACGRFKIIDNYFELSCPPKNLELVSPVSFNEAMGHHVKVDIYRCKVCSARYKITEEYDSHHGTNYVCEKM